MAFRKDIEVQGAGFVNSIHGQISIGPQKTRFNAYCKITTITGDKSSGRVVLECSDDVNRVAFQHTIPFSTEDDAPNFIRQAYLYLKSLPEYAGAVDC